MPRTTTPRTMTSADARLRVRLAQRATEPVQRKLNCSRRISGRHHYRVCRFKPILLYQIECANGESRRSSPRRRTALLRKVRHEPWKSVIELGFQVEWRKFRTDAKRHVAGIQGNLTSATQTPGPEFEAFFFDVGAVYWKNQGSSMIAELFGTSH